MRVFFLHALMRNPFRFVSAGQFMTQETWRHPDRCLDSFEIIIGIEGEVHIHQDDVEHVIRPGQALILFPQHRHGGTRDCNGTTSFYWCHFLCQDDVSILDEAEADRIPHASYAQVEPSNRVGSYVWLPSSFAPMNVDRIYVIFNQLLHVANAKYYNGQAVDYWLTCLLIELCEQYLSEDVVERQANRRFQTMLEWIRINVDKSISVCDLANRFGYNRDYLSRLFKRELKVGPQEYIHSVKMSKARELLFKTDKSIKEIAGQLGYQDEKHFMKLFKVHENLTPSEYRRTYYKSHFNKR